MLHIYVYIYIFIHIYINKCMYIHTCVGCSVRIGRDTAAEGFGYFEDRRPASNVDPYLATGIIIYMYYLFIYT
jgi:glutamine synthetase